MGIGVWAMHFIGMLAFRLPIVVAYNLGITLLSIAPAVVASSIVLYVTSRAEIRFSRFSQLVLAGTPGLGCRAGDCPWTIFFSSSAAVQCSQAGFAKV